MSAATKPRNVRTFQGHDLVADLMAEIDRLAIAQRVAKAREESGMKQHELADLMHVHVRTVQNWESQTKPIVPFDRLDEIASATDSSRFWLLHGTEMPGSAEDAASLAEILRRLESVEAGLADLRLVVAESVQLQAQALGLDERAQQLEVELQQLRADHPHTGTDG